MAITESAKVISPVVELALERWKRASEAEYQIRADCLDDLKFSTGDQWDFNTQTQRQKMQKPCLTMDQIQQSVRLVCNQYRQQPPAIQVNPVGDGSDQETADILQGIFRHIEVNCEAQPVYESVHEGVVRKGFHSCRLLTEYVDDDSDEQEIVIQLIDNAFSVYWQPGVKQEKARWAFIIVDIPTEDYKMQYPDSAMASAYSDYTGIGNSTPDWANEHAIRVAEYFEVEDVDRGKGKRPGKKVVWRKINALEVLDEEELPGTSIPIFTAYGDDLDVDGKRFIAGLVRNGKEPQRMTNYMYSKAVETVALAPTAPWLMAVGQVPTGQETRWEQANSGAYQVLYYNQVDAGGKPAPPPSRNSIEPPIQAIAAILAESKMDVKSALGIYDPSLGQRKGSAESGTAIKSLQQQGSIATLNFADNVGRMMRRLARVTLDWIKVYYPEAKVQRIINPDGTVKQVVIHNGPDQAEEAKQIAEEAGISKIYDIGTGRYDVAFTVGPTYQSKRQEAVDTQMQLLKEVPPETAPLILDLIVRNTDIPQNNEIADRLKKMLPPQLQDGDEGDPQVQLQKAQAQIQQLGQQHQQLAAALEHSTQIINTKQVETQGKSQIAQMQETSKQEIVRMQEATKLAVAQITASKDANQSFAELEIQKYKILHEGAHDLAMQKEQQSHEQDLAAQQAQQASASQQSDQQHEAGMQSSDQAAQAQQAEQANQGGE